MSRAELQHTRPFICLLEKYFFKRKVGGRSERVCFEWVSFYSGWRWENEATHSHSRRCPCMVRKTLFHKRLVNHCFHRFPFDVSTFPLAYVEVTCTDIMFFQIGPIRSTISQVATGLTEQKRDCIRSRRFIGEWLYLDNKWARASEFLLFCFFSLDTELNCRVSVLGDAVVQRLRLGSAGTDWDHTDRKPMDGWTVVSFLSWHPLWLLGVYFKRRRAAESTGTLNQRLLLQWGHSAWMFFPSKQWQIHLRNHLTRTPLSQCPQFKQSLLYIYCPTFSLPSRLASNSEVRISGQQYECLYTGASCLSE